MQPTTQAVAKIFFFAKNSMHLNSVGVVAQLVKQYGLDTQHVSLNLLFLCAVSDYYHEYFHIAVRMILKHRVQCYRTSQCYRVSTRELSTYLH